MKQARLPNLFAEVDDPLAALDEAPAAASLLPGPYAAVALEQGIDKLLDYAVPPRLAGLVRVGQRVKVPLGRGNRPARGYVIAVNDHTRHPRVKPLSGIEDERVLIPPKLMELARWMSRYYVAPLGTVLESVIPSAVKKQVGIGYSQQVRLAKDRVEVQQILEKTKAPKRRAVLARLLLLEDDQTIELNRLANEAGVTPPTVRKLSRLGLVRVTQEVDLPRLTAGMRETAGDEPETTLNDDQRKVFDALAPRLAGGFSVNLLMGVTGSGKTEVYLQCIRDVVAAGRQAIVLVPEIALTPQTVRRFTARFRRVAVLHSGLTATERHRFWQQVSTGHADVVVGARSAVFAPAANPGIIVVDEEHESSYKQDQAPRYHARDVAIKRGQLENIPVLLGSATPSLETYAKATGALGGDREPPSRIGSRGGESQGVPAPGAAPAGTRLRTTGEGEVRVGDVPAPSALADRGGSTSSASPPAPRAAGQLFTLPRRVRGLSMPHVELIDMKQELRMRRGVHLIGARLEALLKSTVGAGRQAILLLNRRGYSNFVYCVSCQEPIGCEYCDATMTYHRGAGTHAAGATAAEGVHTGHLHCHYCLAAGPLPDKCPHCGKKLTLFGLGTQRVEEEITKKFPDLKFARVDSDTMRSSKDYEALLGRFAAGEVQVLLGTQMIAKGLDYPNVTLVGVISGDTALALPDFRAAERTFQLITQVAGRAGRGDSPGRVVLQTFLPDDPTIQAAIKQDFVGFARTELAHRREVGLPPFARMVRVVMRDEDPGKLMRRAEDLAALIADAVGLDAEHVRVKGPMPCAIGRIAGYYRHQIVMLSREASRLQRVLAAVRVKGGLAKADRVAVDVDPVSLL